jgi:sterol desaturase/sphingolipid hydroxylase (fatty acid hydroxylase superfamily)
VHQWLHQRLAHRVIAGWPTSTDVRREMAYSFSTLLIFSAQGLVVFAGILRGDMVVYFKPGQYGTLWLALSLPAMLLWHDFYFYWTHRLLHSRWRCWSCRCTGWCSLPSPSTRSCATPMGTCP